MAITTFTAAQVLTAAQMNAVQGNDFNQTVSTKTASYTLVAADKGTRVVMNVASANTVTVNTSLFSAGDTLVIQNIGAGVTTVTAGTATVSSAGSLAIPQNGSGTLYFTSAGVAIFYPSAVTASSGALVLIATGSLTTASNTFTNAFSATYDNYLVTINGLIPSTGTPSVQLTFPFATSNYSFTALYNDNSSWLLDTSSASASFIKLNQLGSADISYSQIKIMSPFLTEKTAVFMDGQNNGARQFAMTTGCQFDATSFTGFTLASSTAATFAGTVRIYGYVNS